MDLGSDVSFHSINLFLLPLSLIKGLCLEFTIAACWSFALSYLSLISPPALCPLSLSFWSDHPCPTNRDKEREDRQRNGKREICTIPSLKEHTINSAVPTLADLLCAEKTPRYKNTFIFTAVWDGNNYFGCDPVRYLSGNWCYS